MVAAFAALRRMRACRLLRQFSQSTRLEAFPRYRTSDCRKFEPGETWFYDYRTRKMIPGEKLAEPRWHPKDQAAPGPAAKVPHDWESRLH
jgi:hypothetical protein